MQTQHECATMDTGSFWPLAACPEDGTGTGTIVGIVVGVVALAAVGVAVWWLMKRRHG